jgi:hypothetical protein
VEREALGGDHSSQRKEDLAASMSEMCSKDDCMDISGSCIHKPTSSFPTSLPLSLPPTLLPFPPRYPYRQ